MAWTLPVLPMADLFRSFLPSSGAAIGNSAAPPKAPLLTDDPVTTKELRASSRIRFWVPPRLIEGFLLK